MNLISVNHQYSAQFIWNTETTFIRIFFHQEQNEKMNVVKEIGTVLAYYDTTPNEMMLKHWQGECYLSVEHFNDSLIDDLFVFMQKHTQCTSPFLFNVNKGERTYGKYRSVGKVMSLD